MIKTLKSDKINNSFYFYEEEEGEESFNFNF
jgi:hypothetical protein